MTLNDARSAIGFCRPAIDASAACGPVIVIAYFMVSSICGICFADTLTSDILVAPPYFIIPIGPARFVLYINGFWQNTLYLNRDCAN